MSEIIRRIEELDYVVSLLEIHNINQQIALLDTRISLLNARMDLEKLRKALNNG